MALAFGIISNQLEMQSQRISNLETVVRQLEEKFLKATPHITVEDTEVEKFKGLMSSANKELNSLGLKLAFQAQEEQAYLPGMVPVSKYIKGTTLLRNTYLPITEMKDS